MRSKVKSKKKINDPVLENYQEGCRLVNRHPLFSPLWHHVWIVREKGNLCPADGWAVVTQNGYLHVNPDRLGEPEEWAYVLAHCMLHLGMGHFRKVNDFPRWNAACDCFVTRFLSDLKLGTAPGDIRIEPDLSASSELALYRRFRAEGFPPTVPFLGTAGEGMPDMVPHSERIGSHRRVRWKELLGTGLARAVTSAIDVAAGRASHLGARTRDSLNQRAKEWFVGSYPLLGALAASFDIVEDPLVCRRSSIATAAVDAEGREIFMNPAAGLSESETRFIMAHELMHVALRHQARRQGRDPYLWNIACDYVINGWLVEMGVGEIPEVGALYDPELQGLSAEDLYDRIVTDMRRYRKLATLRGIGLSDILERENHDWWSVGQGVELDEFYRRCLALGLVYHNDENRGRLPSGLIEEIRSLSQPPVPWDVELARWFDHQFQPMEQRRTYARPSRRQSATPGIPRPSWYIPEEVQQGRTYGVVLDTSGSMDRTLLAKALGSIASYSRSRQVPFVRVVFCDAAPYDQGYLPPEAIADRVRVRGRGGTVLQPALDLLERAEDFPKAGPVLIITDGYCERLRVTRRHAFLIPKGNQLPFVPRGPVFRMG